MVYVSDFTPSVHGDIIDVENSFIEFCNTENGEKELYTLFNVMSYSDFFISKQILGLIFHPRDDNDVYISVFYGIVGNKTSNEDVNSIIGDINPLSISYNKDSDDVENDYSDYENDIIFSPKLGYAIKLDSGYIVKVNSDSFFTYNSSDYHIRLDKDCYNLDTNIESKWFRKQKLVHKAVIKEVDNFESDLKEDVNDFEPDEEIVSDGKEE